MPSSDWLVRPARHAAGQSAAAVSAEAELQSQEGGGGAAGCLRREKTLTLRVEKDTGETCTRTRAQSTAWDDEMCHLSSGEPAQKTRGRS